MTPTEIAAHMRLIENQLQKLRNQIESASDSAPSVAIRKLPAPAVEAYTSPKFWRGHIRALHSELLKHFGQDEFCIRDLREFCEARVHLTPFDRQARDRKPGKQNLIWHQAIHDAIDVKPHTWGDCGGLIVYVSRNRWRLAS